MADQIIPLDTSPDQTFAVALSVDGSNLTLQLRIYFSEMAQYWLMDISDANGNPLLASIPMVTGSWPAANLLQQYGYMRIGSAYIINASGTSSDYPNSKNLTADFALLWSDTPSF